MIVRNKVAASEETYDTLLVGKWDHLVTNLGATLARFRDSFIKAYPPINAGGDAASAGDDDTPQEMRSGKNTLGRSTAHASVTTPPLIVPAPILAAQQQRVGGPAASSSSSPQSTDRPFSEKVQQLSETDQTKTSEIKEQLASPKNEMEKNLLSGKLRTMRTQLREKVTELQRKLSALKLPEPTLVIPHPLVAEEMKWGELCRSFAQEMHFFGITLPPNLLAKFVRRVVQQQRTWIQMNQVFMGPGGLSREGQQERRRDLNKWLTEFEQENKESFNEIDNAPNQNTRWDKIAEKLQLLYNQAEQNVSDSGTAISEYNMELMEKRQRDIDQKQRVYDAERARIEQELLDHKMVFNTLMPEINELLKKHDKAFFLRNDMSVLDNYTPYTV